MRPLSNARRACFALALAAVAFTGAVSAEEATFHPPMLVAPAALPATAPAVMVGIDNATGLLRQPTVGERLELAALVREATGLRRATAASEIRHADGSVSLALDPALFNATTVFVTADGEVHFACGDAGHYHPITVTAPAAEDR